jgi:hypothetical protein
MANGISTMLNKSSFIGYLRQSHNYVELIIKSGDMISY